MGAMAASGEYAELCRLSKQIGLTVELHREASARLELRVQFPVKDGEAPRYLAAPFTPGRDEIAANALLTELRARRLV
jgi:hypothetical protein